MRSTDARKRFRFVVDALFDRIEEHPEQFPEYALLAVKNGKSLFHVVRRVVLPKPFPYALFFYVRRGVAIVLAIAHSKRRPGYWAERR